MRARQPYWQSYWYDLRFRPKGTPSFEPMNPDGPRPVPDESLALGTVDEFAERLLAVGVDELDDLCGELRVLVYTEAAPAPGTEPVLVRTVELGRR
ncbi:hypothetical protein CS0771_49160 [Catellatospora sp. IY07-71]|uniref:hypothetical protein n=1 Tax=Catellatospora sp. IY07-71 TaxID=2728827 RepID=UPI001BB41457|nr:hypothetical protein [Catellatospora sp. IY07-71]BCJ75372.1 hypothetical protein CS0771_49160 [Catellatospora sp. IY07-71]